MVATSGSGVSPSAVTATVMEADGTIHGVLRHRMKVIAGAPVPPPPNDLRRLLRQARRRLCVLADTGIVTTEVEALERVVEAASQLSPLLEATADLEIWAQNQVP
ncbi:MAG: hypothetical protein AAGA48_08820 [Myxococcota bacterium]